jgi:hypothetical protein
MEILDKQLFEIFIPYLGVRYVNRRDRSIGPFYRRTILHQSDDGRSFVGTCCYRAGHDQEDGEETRHRKLRF